MSFGCIAFDQIRLCISAHTPYVRPPVVVVDSILWERRTEEICQRETTYRIVLSKPIRTTFVRRRWGFRRAPALMSFLFRAVLDIRPLGARASILEGCVDRPDCMPSILQLNIHTAASVVAVTRCNVTRKRKMRGKTPASYLHRCLRGLTGCSKPTLPKEQALRMRRAGAE